jgi:hypothetical protein
MTQTINKPTEQRLTHSGMSWHLVDSKKVDWLLLAQSKIADLIHFILKKTNKIVPTRVLSKLCLIF